MIRVEIILSLINSDTRHSVREIGLVFSFDTPVSGETIGSLGLQVDWQNP